MRGRSGERKRRSTSQREESASGSGSGADSGSLGAAEGRERSIGREAGERGFRGSIEGEVPEVKASTEEWGKENGCSEGSVRTWA
jgi:hypothetical protein